jgi:hypothetical protein
MAAELTNPRSAPPLGPVELWGADTLPEPKRAGVCEIEHVPCTAWDGKDGCLATECLLR